MDEEERFPYRLCLALGGWPHPDYLLEALTPEQLEGWRRFHAREPFGFPWQDYRAGLLASTIAAAAGAKDVNTRTFMLHPPAEGELDDDEREDRLAQALMAPLA